MPLPIGSLTMHAGLALTPLGLSGGHQLSPVQGAEQKEPSMAAIELEISSAKQWPRAGLRRAWGVSVA